jgi:hypothetical protein
MNWSTGQIIAEDCFPVAEKRPCARMEPARRARVAELADALDSGSSE